eukprot:TRINITY_DN5726_c0_g1_i1.p1 TRINITY_DN5726_c0_g1~~TRINITY_DN5726_c0_g1_i1.p1  ORF type:complete len:220 (+),score=47.27 TRINITY_DN5726_c0_g1_i1:26-685(+)
MENFRFFILFALLEFGVHARQDSGWTIVWQDDFDGPAGSTPNSAYWTPREMPGLSGNKELEYYASDHVYLDGKSHLVLKSEPLAQMGYNYTSGWVDSQQKWNSTFGKWEIRAQLPTGQGIWPAHWLMPDWGICWPMGGEIDIMERINTVPMVHGALHYDTLGPCYTNEESDGGWSPTLAFDPSQDFHLYGIIWDQQSDSLQYYIDDLFYTNATEQLVLR